MFLSRAGSAGRTRCSSTLRCTNQYRSPLSGGSYRAWIRTQTARRVESRAIHLQPSSKSAVSKISKARTNHQYGSTPKILQSAFPKKTFIFLVLLAAAAYYAVDVRDLDWTDDVMNSFEVDNPGITPLQFFANKEELDHYLQFHIPDASQPLKNPDVARFFSENFERLAGGWMMSEKDAVEENIPVTHGCRFKSNEPCEDFFALGTSPGPGARPWNYWTIMDGHAGRHTAFYLQNVLIPSLSSALTTLPAHSSPFEVESTIKSTFLRIDKQLMDSARTAANWFPAATAATISALTPAFSGSCALLAAFDPATSTLRVACTGDSRAVLGRWDSSSQTYTPIALSEDQTGFNEKEAARLTTAHPDEPDMLDPKSGRLLGIAVTRAFGDHRWKWDNDFIRTVQAKFWGSAPRPQSKTPPYMTAEPEVTETAIERGGGGGGGGDSANAKADFMIMASDGLWDRISSAHAVECVQRWLEARDRGHGSVRADPRLHAAQHPDASYPSPMAEDPGLTYDPATGAQVDWKATPEYFAIEDENAAVCLARNAMGGSRRSLFMGVLSVPPPMGRYAVDDTTVMVVFFDRLEEGGSGKGKGETAKKKSWWKFW